MAVMPHWNYTIKTNNKFKMMPKKLWSYPVFTLAYLMVKYPSVSL